MRYGQMCSFVTVKWEWASSVNVNTITNIKHPSCFAANREMMNYCPNSSEYSVLAQQLTSAWKLCNDYRKGDGILRFIYPQRIMQIDVISYSSEFCLLKLNRYTASKFSWWSSNILRLLSTFNSALESNILLDVECMGKILLHYQPISRPWKWSWPFIKLLLSDVIGKSV